MIGFNVPTTVTVNAQANDLSTKLVLTRDAAMPCWSSSNLQSNKVHGVAFDLLALDNQDSQTTWKFTGEALDSDSVSVIAGNQTATVTKLGVASASAPPVVPIGQDLTVGECPFVFIPDAMDFIVSVCFNWTATAASNTIDVVLEQWLQPGRTVDTVVGLSNQYSVGTYGVGSVVRSGIAGAETGKWYRVSSVSVVWQSASVSQLLCTVGLFAAPAGSSFAGSGSNMGTLNAVTSSNTDALMPLFAPPEFSISREPYRDTKVTAVALLATNVTSVMYKQGTCLAGRLSPERASFEQVAEVTVGTLHPAEKALLPLETGYYTYVPPGSDLATFSDYTYVADGPRGNQSSYLPVFRLDNKSYYNVAFFDVAANGSASNFALTVSLHLEFRTSSALFPLAVSGTTLETLHLAQMGLMQAGFFFENPEHKSLLNRIVNGIKRLEPYAAPAITLAKAVHPPTGRVLAAAATAAKAFTAIAGAKRGQSNKPKKLAVRSGPVSVRATSVRTNGAMGTRARGRKR